MDWVGASIAGGVGVTAGFLLGSIRRKDPPRKILERVGASAIASAALVVVAVLLTSP